MTKTPDRIDRIEPQMRTEQVFADRLHLTVPTEQWEVFRNVLDRPARQLPRLQRLMREPTVLESADD